jgi:hypothetical protein
MGILTEEDKLAKKKNQEEYKKQVLNEKLPAFKAELKALLEKYDAVIGASYKGDTHGIYDEEFFVSFKCPRREREDYEFEVEAVLYEFGISIDKNDL